MDKDTLEMQQSNVENLFANDNERMYPKETWEQGLTTAELADKANEKIRNSKNDIIPYIIASGKERCIVDILQYVNDNMTAQETIDVIDRYQCNDTSSKKNYAKTTTPSAETACETCSGKSKTRSKENFWIQTGDDKASLAIVDKNGKKSYIDLGPNNQHLVQINTVTSNDGPSLPTNVTMSDVSKTVVTKDYIMYECTPKLAELYNETYINNVYYDFNKTDIAKDGYRELDRMVVIALKNPDLMFEVASHADERGAEEYNQKLTDRRLKTVTDYITHKGFNIDRIVGKSYGKSQPLIKNAKTEEEHTLNRRTTFKLFIPNLKNELADKKYAIAESSPATKQTLHYRVQVGAYRTPVADPITVYNNLLTNAKGAELSYFLDSDGLYKYSFGIFNNLQDARSLCKLFLNLGTECYVAAYFNGNRITVNEAIMLSKHK